MLIGLLAALLASVAYGVSAVLQAYGADRAAAVAHVRGTADQYSASGGPSVRSTVAAALTPAFVIGCALDLVGFGVGAAAARMIPLFLSQTIISGNLVVTALLGAVVLKTRLRLRELAGILVVVLSLVVVATVAGHRGADHAPAGVHWIVFVASVVLLGLGLLIVRRLGSGGAVAAGLTAGVLFGAVAVGVRIANGVSPFELSVLLMDPAVWTIVLGGLGGFYLYTVGLQLGSVNGAVAAVVAGETVVPSIVGVLLLGDATRPGWGWLAVAGFVAAVAGAIAVATMGRSGPRAQHRTEVVLLPADQRVHT